MVLGLCIGLLAYYSNRLSSKTKHKLITQKELKGFKIPEILDFGITNRLAKALENKLEDTKVYVGTKQTEYEYKHKECVEVIHEIDDYINGLYGLSAEEGIYIKNFSYRYRVSGGARNGRN